MAGGERGLQGIGTAAAAERPAARERVEAAPDQQRIPARTVLLEQQHRPALRVDPGVGARGLQLHQRDQAVDLALVGHQAGEHPAEAQRLVAERRPHPVVAGGGRVALVEDQVDDLEHRRQPRRPLARIRHLERHPGRGERALGADDALGDRRFRHEEGTGDLVGAEAAEQAQGERDPALGGQERMAGGEHQAQQVVADVVGARLGQRVDEVRLDVRLQRLQVGAELLVLARMQRLLAQAIEGAVLGGAHQPGAGVVGHAVVGPVLERGDERVLGQLLGETDVANHPGDAGDHLRRLDPPDRVDRAMGRLGGRHRAVA